MMMKMIMMNDDDSNDGDDDYRDDDVHHMLTSFFASTSTVSCSIFVNSFSVSPDVLISSGWRSVSSFCMTATCDAANSSFSKPTTYLFFMVSISFLLRVNSFLKVSISSRYDVGVT